MEIFAHTRKPVKVPVWEIRVVHWLLVANKLVLSHGVLPALEDIQMYSPESPTSEIGSGKTVVSKFKDYLIFTIKMLVFR